MPVLAAGFAILAQQGLLAFGVVNAAAYATSAFAVGSAVLTGAAGVGISLVGQALAPKAKRPEPVDGRLNLKQPIPPRVWITGIARTGGNYFIFESKNGTLYQGILFCEGPVHTINNFFVNEDNVALNVNGGVTIPDNFTYKGNIYLFIEARLGTVPNTVSNILTTNLPELWTNAHRLDGICYAVAQAFPVKIEKFQTVFPKGQPQIGALVHGSKMYDHRKPGHVVSNPATWEWSDNPVISLRWYITTRAGLGLSDATWITPNDAEWDLAATFCDTLVANVAGFEKRYRAWLRFTSETEPSDVIAAYLRACDGWLYTRADGTLGIKCGYTASTVVIDDIHIRSTSMRVGSRQERTINELKLNYLSQDHGFKQTPGVSWRDEVSISSRGLLSRDFDADMVPSHSQARRLLKLEFERINALASGVTTTDLAGLQAMGERFITLRLPRLGFTVVEVTRLNLDLKDMSVSIEWRTVSDAIINNTWNPAAEEGQTPVVPVDPDNVPLAVPAETFGYKATPDIVVIDWLRTGYTQYNFEIQYRNKDIGGSIPGDWIDVPTFSAMEYTTRFATQFPPAIVAATLEFRMRSSYGSKVSDWTAIDEVAAGIPFIDDVSGPMSDDDGTLMVEDV